MTEMDKLDAMLTEKGIAHIYDRAFQGGTQIVVPDAQKWYWDAVCTPYSYGGRAGYLEVMGINLLRHCGVEGWLTAEAVIILVNAAEKLGRKVR